MSISSKLMAYPSWTAQRRIIDQPQPIQPPDWPICFPQRRAPDEDVPTRRAAPSGYGDDEGTPSPPPVEPPPPPPPSPTEPIVLVLEREVDAPNYDCNGATYFEPYVITNTFSVNAQLVVDADVDDELLINGVINNPGEASFIDDLGNCPLHPSGAHISRYETILAPGQSVTINAGNNYAGVCSIYGTATLSPL